MSRSKKTHPELLNSEQIADLERSEREANIRVDLLKLGVRGSQILELLERFPLDRIERQLEWLPYRRARKPSSLIVSAIKEDYEIPSAALEQQPESSSSSDLTPINKMEVNGKD